MGPDMLSCLVVSYTQRPSGFKAIIKSIFKTNLPSLCISQFQLRPSPPRDNPRALVNFHFFRANARG